MEQPSSAAHQRWRARHLHLVGIAGAGMSGLALLAHALGAEVTGSDLAASPYLAPLGEAGINVTIGPHRGESLPAGSELVYSSAVAPDNPERVAARERGQPELARAVLLAQVAQLRRVLAVAGTHGKTTTASMAVAAMLGAGLDPGYLIGGTLQQTARNAAWGSGDWLVVEADESDRSLLGLRPAIAVLVNAELDHHASFGSRLDVDEVFRAYLASSERAVVGGDPRLVALAGATPVVTVPSPPAEPISAIHGGAGTRFRWRGHEVALATPGAHNAANAAVALEASVLAGAEPSLTGFRGAARRFERLGRSAAGADLYDDYAHHPTEVRATLQAARTLAPRRLLAVFQPHLYSRTRALADAFGVALAAADVVCVLDVYGARERARDFPGVSGRLVAEAAADAAAGRSVAWLPSFDDAERFLVGELHAGDVCLFLGAGDIDALGRRLTTAAAAP